MVQRFRIPRKLVLLVLAASCTVFSLLLCVQIWAIAWGIAVSDH